MCLKTTIFEPTILEEDLMVYKYMKILDGKIISPFQGFEYELGLLYQTELGVTKHTFISEWSYRTYDYIAVNEGFHSYYRYIDVSSFINFKKDGYIFECTIPKGTITYISHRNIVLASNQIIINKLCA